MYSISIKFVLHIYISIYLFTYLFISCTFMTIPLLIDDSFAHLLKMVLLLIMDRIIWLIVNESRFYPDYSDIRSFNWVHACLLIAVILPSPNSFWLILLVKSSILLFTNWIYCLQKHSMWMVIFFFFLRKMSHSSSCPLIYYITQAGLKLLANCLLSSQVLVLQACLTMPKYKNDNLNLPAISLWKGWLLILK